MSTSRKPACSGPSKKINSWVRPGVLEVRASALRPVSALIRLDLPTLERPAKATSTPAIGGNVSIEGEAQMNLKSPANNLRPCSISFASDAAVMRGSGAASSGRHCEERQRRSNPFPEGLDCFASLAMTIERYVFDSAFLPNVALTLSNNSTFTPLRRMIRLCCKTESRLFQAQ